MRNGANGRRTTTVPAARRATALAVLAAAAMLALAVLPPSMALAAGGGGHTFFGVGSVNVAPDEVRQGVDIAVGQVGVSGTVSGSVSISAGMASVAHSGQVAGDVSVTAGEADVRGIVGGDVTVDDGQISVADDGRVGGSLHMEGKGRVVVFGTVGGDIFVQSGKVTLEPGAHVGGEVHVVEGRVDGAAGASVGGRVQVDTPLSESQVNDLLGSGSTSLRSSHASVDGISFGNWHWPGDWNWPHPGRWGGGYGVGAHLASGLGMAVVIFLVGLLALALFPHAEEVMRGGVRGQLWRSLLVGVLMMLLAIPAMVLLAISIVGIPVAVLLPFALVVVFLLGEVVAYHALGRLVQARFWPQMEWHPLAVLGAGAALAFLVSFVPVVGWLASFAAAVVGGGAVVLTRFGHRAA